MPHKPEDVIAPVPPLSAFLLTLLQAPVIIPPTFVRSYAGTRRAASAYEGLHKINIAPVY